MIRLLLQNLRLPLYLANEQLEIEFVSDELKQLLGHEPAKVTDLLNDEDIDRLKTDLKLGSSQADVYFRADHSATFYGRHTASRVKTEGDGCLIAGFVESRAEWELLKNELDALQTILHQAHFGVHVLKRPESKRLPVSISWINEFEKNLLHLPAGSTTAASLVTSETEEEQARSVQDKFFGHAPETDFREREFAVYENGEKADERTIPVRIKDYFLFASPLDHEPTQPPERIVTAVFPMQLDDDVVRFLKERGPKYPAFEAMGIRAAEKTQNTDNRIVITWVNPSFGNDVRCLDGNSHLTDEDLCSGQYDDKDLFGEKIGRRFLKEDGDVLDTGNAIQGIEPHPYESGEGTVQFIKIATDGGPGRKGLSVFYWPCDKTEFVKEELTRLFRDQGERVLNDLPALFQIVRKNREKQFTYVNRRYCEEHGRDMQDLLGKTDEEVFGVGSQTVDRYRSDDERVITRKARVVARTEMHQASPNQKEREVNVIKTPVTGEANEIEGVQAVFWYGDEWDTLKRRTLEIDNPEKLAAADVFVSYARRDQDFVCGTDNRGRTTLEDALKALRETDGISFWIDTQRTKDEHETAIRAQIEKARVFIILLSSHYIGSSFIQTKELPWIQARKESSEQIKIIPVIAKSLTGSLRKSTSDRLVWLSKYAPVNLGNGQFRETLQQLFAEGKEDVLWREVCEQIRSGLKEAD